MKKILYIVLGSAVAAGFAVWFINDLYKTYHSLFIPVLFIALNAILILLPSKTYIIHFLGETEETHRRVQFICIISQLLLYSLLTFKLEDLIFGTGVAVVIETFRFIKAKKKDDVENTYSESEDMIK